MHSRHQANPTPSFIPGLSLSRAFYEEVVAPILAQIFPSTPYSAGLIGSGSEVLGFDDEMSTDHHWGPRLQLFVAEDSYAELHHVLTDTLAYRLPPTFRGYSTHFSEPNPDDHGTQLLEPIERGLVNHRVEVWTLRRYLLDYLGYDVETPLSVPDWLTFPQQKLRTLTAGGIFHDEVGLNPMRECFAWYPHDVWLYLLAAGWARIGQEEHLMGRAGVRGDELGAGLIGSRLVRDVMRLAFLMERRYAPYPKWFGTAFAQLDAAPVLTPHLLGAEQATDWQTRQPHLVAAYGILARMHNRLNLTPPMPERATQFFGRPFQVIGLHGFSSALLAQITDPAVKQIASQPPIGGIDLLSDNTDLLENRGWRPTLRRLWE